jgi:hypothetical protein
MPRQAPYPLDPHLNTYWTYFDSLRHLHCSSPPSPGEPFRVFLSLFPRPPSAFSLSLSLSFFYPLSPLGPDYRSSLSVCIPAGSRKGAAEFMGDICLFRAFVFARSGFSVYLSCYKPPPLMLASRIESVNVQNMGVKGRDVGSGVPRDEKGVGVQGGSRHQGTKRSALKTAMDTRAKCMGYKTAAFPICPSWLNSRSKMNKRCTQTY